MSENQNPQGGTPNPYGNKNPYGDPNPYANPAPSPQPEPSVYFDPNNNPNAYPPESVITGAPGGGQSRFDNQPAQNWGVHPQQQAEANTKATLALVLGIVSFFFLGAILSIPGYFLAKQAELLNGENAKAARIVNLISIGVSIVGGLFFILIFILGIAGSHSSR